MSTNATKKQERKLIVPGTVYQIPADTHADLDLQDDKEQVLQRYSYRARPRHLNL